MRHWPAAGVRPYLYLRAQHRICPPCHPRSFGRLAANNIRHTLSLLDRDAHPDPASGAHPPAETRLDNLSPDHVQSAGPDTTVQPSKERKPRSRRTAQKKAPDTETQDESGPPPESKIPRTGGRRRPVLVRRVNVSFRDSARVHAREAEQLRRQRQKTKEEKKQRPKKERKRKPSQIASDNAEDKHDTAASVEEGAASTGDADTGVARYAPNGTTIRTLKDVMLGRRHGPPPPKKELKTARARPRIRFGGIPQKLDSKNNRSSEQPEQTAEALTEELGAEVANVETIYASDFELTALDIEQPPVPRLFHGLDRVLFNQGVYQLQDPRSKVFNFDPYLQKIMPVTEFDYNALKEYKTSSQDTILSDIANQHGKRYVGSTSSMTGTLAHFHYLLSNWRKINLTMLSREFPDQLDTFTELNRAPNAIFLRWKNGTYAIDADKQYDGANVLMLLGKSMEKLLTMPTDEFERYRKGKSHSISDEERNGPESYHYSTQGDFLMRSQLDAYDPRLPGTGMFDLKTRAVVSIRMQAADYEDMSGYEIHKHLGQFESFEREYYDMMRSTTLKYSLQARMGRMDGIFVAYHNVKRIFGFQYLSLNEMDRALHGQTDRSLGNQEFSLSIELLNKAMNKATEKFPNQSIRFHFEARPATSLTFMYIFAEPMAEDDINTIQNSQKEKVAEYERSIMGVSKEPETTDTTESTGTDDGIDSEMGPDEAGVCEIESGTLNVTGVEVAESVDSVVSAATPDQQESETMSEDSTFLSLLEPKEKPNEEERTAPLLAMVLTIRSKVNGRIVERPENLGPQDGWEVEYSLAEVTSSNRAWALYEAAKARRKKLYDKLNRKTDDDAANDDSKRARNNDYYVDMLRRMSQKGRELREEIDSAEVDKAQVVVGEPLGRVERDTGGAKKDTVDAEIAGAEDYMAWLFSNKESADKL